MADATAPALPYADVVVDVTTTHPDNTFTYEAPERLALRPGHLVRVPFGRRPAQGVVAALRAETDLPYTRPVDDLVLPEPVVTEAGFALARWVARYYRASLFEALAPMLPPGFRAPSHSTVRLLADVEPPAELPKGARTLLAHLRAHPGRQRAASLAKRLGPWVYNAVRVLEEAGVVECEWALAEGGQSLASPASRTQVLRAARPPEQAAAWADANPHAPKRAALMRALADAPRIAAEARAAYGSGAVSALVKAGVAELAPQENEHAAQPEPEPEQSLLPTPPQAEALAAIRAALDDPAVSPRSFLLQGVTGSGKTEVYLQAIAHCLALGKRAIVLVPELSLTPQTLARFERRFPGQVGQLHSGLTPPQQREEWRRCANGERGVLIGSRGAVFAPQPELGLIVLDEEHEWTYKQEDAAPRYHARDVALRRAALTGAAVILGSATPSLVSAYGAGRGVHRRIDLPRRIEASGAPAPLANVSVVDMREELRNGNRGIFSEALRDGLAQTYRRGEQSVLFLNRRGSAGSVECRACGYAARCHRCGVAYTYHANKGLVCHYCNGRRSAPARCPNCRSPHIRYLGLGVQRLVEEVEELLPGARVLRWDSDSARTVKEHAALLERFASGEADVLVGTQMIAKGLHVPSVTLVGVALADIGLHAPDFNAAERAFQVLVQVSGRAGRGADPGHVVIQTYAPEHYAIQAAADQDYETFYEQEMAVRRSLNAPPFTRLARLTFATTNEGAARREAQRLAAMLKREARAQGMRYTDVLGPAPPYPPRLRGLCRWRLIIRGPDPHRLIDAVPLPANWSVDIDPVSGG